MNRKLLSGTFLLVSLTVLACGARAQIVSDATASASSNALGTSLTWSHTIANATGRILVVGVAMRIDTANSGPGPSTRVLTVTFNGTALTCLAALADNVTGSCGNAATGSSTSGYGRAEIWVLLNPAVTTASIIVTTNNSTVIAAGSTSYSGVQSVSSGGASGSNNGVTGSTLGSLGPVTTPVNGLVVDAFGCARSASATASGTGHTRLTDASDNASANFHIRSDVGQDAATNPTMTWTLSLTSPWAQVAAVLTPAKRRKNQTVIG
jgi:hypothetical protein